MLTNCCGVEFYEDTDICSNCMEHADEQESEDCCMARACGFPEDCRCTKGSRYDEDEYSAYENYRDGLDEEERLNND